MSETESNETSLGEAWKLAITDSIQVFKPMLLRSAKPLLCTAFGLLLAVTGTNKNEKLTTFFVITGCGAFLASTVPHVIIPASIFFFLTVRPTAKNRNFW